LSANPTVVVDHDSGRLVWAVAGRDEATLKRFFDLLGAGALRPGHPRLGRRGGMDRHRGRPTRPTRGALRRSLPHRGLGHRRIGRRAAGGLECCLGPASHRSAHRPARRRCGEARSIKRARYALWKNPENLTEHQAAKLAWIAKTEPRLCRIPAFVQLQRKIVKYRAAIDAT